MVNGERFVKFCLPSEYEGKQMHSSTLGNCLLLLSRFSRVRLCGTPWTAAHQAPPSLGFSRQEHWSGLPLLFSHFLFYCR